MRAGAPRSARRPLLLPARARGAGGNAVEPGHYCRVDNGLEMPLSQRSGDGTRRDGRVGPRVPSHWTRPHQSGLPPRRWSHRLDRSTNNRKQRPLTGTRRVPMVRAFASRPCSVSRLFGKRSMLLTDLVAPNAIIPALKVNGKKQILQELAAKAAEL